MRERFFIIVVNYEILAQCEVEDEPMLLAIFWYMSKTKIRPFIYRKVSYIDISKENMARFNLSQSGYCMYELCLAVAIYTTEPEDFASANRE